MENQYVVSISHTTVGELLNSNELRPHLSKYWCIAKQNDVAFVANMEDILTVYQLPYHKEIPIICMDENPLQLLGKSENSLRQHPYTQTLTRNSKRANIAKN